MNIDIGRFIGDETNDPSKKGLIGFGVGEDGGEAIIWIKSDEIETSKKSKSLEHLAKLTSELCQAIFEAGLKESKDTKLNISK